MQNAHHGTAQAGTEFRDAEKDCCKARLSTTGTYCSLDAWMPDCLVAKTARIRRYLLHERLKKAVGRLGGLNHDVDQNLPPNF